MNDALNWLASHQDQNDGHWSAAGFGSECAHIGESARCDGEGSPEYDVGVTGLALLAFLGAGHTNTEGNYRNTVDAGLNYLIDVQAPDGNFGVASNERSTYDHMIATLAMVEGYALTKTPRFKESASKALEFIYATRSPERAWRYSPSSSEMVSRQVNDSSVTSWAILAITLAREYHLPFDQAALDDAMAFIDEMTDAESGITGYDRRGGRPHREQGEMAEHWPDDQSEATTAAAVLCRIFADPELALPGNREMVEKGVRVIAALPPSWDGPTPVRPDFHFWYYGTYALYQHGGLEWDTWKVALQKSVMELQRRDGDARGSWDPQVDPWGAIGGRVYSTALLALTMEVFYLY